MYLKLQSSCLLFSNMSSRHEEADLEESTAVGMGMEQKTDSGKDSDGDDLWNGLETVGCRKRRTKSELAINTFSHIIKKSC